MNDSHKKHGTALQTSNTVRINSNMNNLLNDFHILVTESGYAECDASWGYFDSKKINILTPYAHLYYIINGSGRLYYNDNVVELKPGNLYFIPPFLRHSRECEYIEQIFFHINIFTQNSPDAKDVFINRKTILSIPIEDMNELLTFYKSNRFSDFFKLYTFLMTDISKIISAYDFDIDNNISYNNITNLAIFYIKENLSARLRVFDIAKKLYVSKSKLNSLFYRDIGMHISKYIETQLVQEIKFLLLETNLTTKEISDKLLFSNRSYFSKFVKKNIGFSPKQFRLAYKNTID